MAINKAVKIRVVTTKEIYMGTVIIGVGDLYTWFRTRNHIDGQGEFLQIKPQDGSEDILIRNTEIISVQQVGDATYVD